MKVAIVDYIGYTSIQGRPIGHDLKTLDETKRLIREFDSEILAPKAYIKEIADENTKILPGSVIADGKKDNFFRNIKRALLEFRNIHFAFKHYEADYLWFCNVDQFFFLYCFIRRIPLNNVIITEFVTRYPKRYHNFCFSRCLEKLKLAVMTNQECIYHGANIVFVPDYLYYSDVYDKYKCSIREEKVLCLGVMNSAKRIKELVKTFCSIDYQLEIHGYFPDKKYLQELKDLERKNIEIIDEYMKYEEMLKQIGSVKYVIFPYDMAAYAATTSGILLECVFLETIPIAPVNLLKKSGFYGLDIEQIDEQMLGGAHLDINEHNVYLTKDLYSADKYRDQIRERLLREELVS